jgi:hypothetical protein
MATTNFSALNAGDYNIRISTLTGGSAGDLTLTGITTDDSLLSVSVLEFDVDGDAASAGELTSEFSITAADTINNTGGTATTDQIVLVFWVDDDAN